ncbi:small GTP-binding protein [Spirochaeta thermophila DSM 6578]|uniref:Elongation factor G n=1 Tax=Winmispira thermophila (strain ATCC 700085 / DSM 6578 / Z-1203) TaxID=869211 RepID=G0GEQ9_WINT7|nr:elongation factor G [Spirochaeta thermophila]AEJ61465.1 small GTP-binding protein [Spirochaeta thermophila DSM 6578]
MSVSTATIRNLSVVGHGGTGKTTLVEHILYAAGVIDKPETVESGRTVSDFLPEEIENRFSIKTALSAFTWKDIKINLFDTPGAGDFIGEVISAFRASDCALMVVDAKSGVQIETIKLWRRLDMRNMPRMVFINKIELDNAGYDKTVEDLKERFHKTFIPVTIPLGEGTDYRGVINLLTMKAHVMDGGQEKEVDIPEEYREAAEQAHLELIEAAAEGDDELTEKYFEAGTLTIEEAKRGLAEGLKENKFVPVLCGSALLHSGINDLFHVINEIAPSPEALSEPILRNGEEDRLPVDPNAPFCGYVFKTFYDQFSGKLSFIKVVQGSLTPGAEVLNLSEQKKERVSKVFTAIGKKLVETSGAVAGDIAVVTKADSLRTNDTLAVQEIDFRFKPLALPQPIFSLAIGTDSKKEQDKLGELLHREAEEDLTFTLTYNPETKETVISGMGELHINMILNKIREKFKINVHTKTPEVAYRETITKPASAEYTHKKQTGGHGQYARVVMEIKPLPRGEIFAFHNAIHGGAISKNYIPGVEKGVREGMEAGILAGYPVVDLEATVVDGKEHPVDSSELAFKIAAREALKDALTRAGCVLLEPIMKLTVFIEEQYLGDILSDLSGRRGKVLGQKPIGGGIVEVDALVPQAELLRYAIDLKSMTSGTGSFEIEFSHYEPISGRIAEEVIKRAQSRQEEVKAGQ